MQKGVEIAATSVATRTSVPERAQTSATAGAPSTCDLSSAAGVGELIDADLSAASIQISRLEVQQQLGVQALTIVNANTQRLLKLFDN